MRKINIPIWVLSLLFFFCSIGGICQQYIYKNFNSTHGLPSSECYDVVQDSKGYIWIATDHGIAKYNGQEFKVFDQNNGLKSNVVFRLFSKNNRIWFFTYNQYLQYIENDSVKTPSYSARLKNILDSIGAKSSELSVDSNGLLLLSTKKHIPPTQFIRVGPNGEIEILNKKKSEEYQFYIQLDVGHSPVQGGWSNDLMSRKHEPSVWFQRSDNVQNSFRLKLLDGKFSINENVSYVIQNDRLELFCAQNLIYSIHGNKMLDSISVTNQIVGSLVKVDSNSFALGRQGKSLIRFNRRKGSLNQVDSSNVSINSISGGMVDQEGGLWLTSIKNGVFYIRNPNIYTLPEPFDGERINGLIQHQQKNWVAKDDYDLYSIDPISQTVVDHYIFKEQFRGFKKSGNKLIVLNLEADVPNDDSLEFIQTSATGSIIMEDTLVIAGPLSVYFIVDRKLIRIDSMTSPTVYKCVNRNKNALYFGTLNGIQKYDLGSQTFIDEQTVNPSINFQINAIEKLGDKLLLASNGSGIIIIDKNDSLVSTIDVEHGLSSNYCNSIYKAGDSTFWISTMGGITKLSISGSFQIKTQVFNQSHGLLANEVLCCNKIGNHLYVGTQLGLCYIDLTKEHFNTTSPKVYLEKITVNDSLLNSGGNVSLSNTMNDLQFFFAGLTFKRLAQYKFKYRLLHENETSEYITLNQPQIRLPNLSPGNYLFEVLAVNNDDVESIEPARFSFTILPPWWATWWFRGALVLGVGLIIYGILKFRFDQLKKKNELETRTKELKQMALNAQLNPHFIFNSMGSIQSLIMEGELLVAENYLTKFSKLLRSVLNRSSEHFSILKEEMELVKDYVNIENLRFKGKIELVVDINGIDTNKTKIPAMLIHTVVENAIIHGILPSKRQGMIKILFNLVKDSNHQIRVVIEDNGIGIAESKVRKETKLLSHESKGLNIIHERLHTYSSLYQGQFSITHSDLTEGDGGEKGTRVELIVPSKPC
ncbi:MAG: hypothetical protein CL840_07945 [Crocinitomicaceae bacterium]|nr:hypothetical protein [Crocinitomicaceae bacterium]|tara:strand:- start:4802 stop:7756 length:2955 start_codon:yes stop_codon:yes gene_type:complete